MTLIAHSNEKDTGLEYVDQQMPDGTVQRRYLTAMPTPADHPLKQSRGWEAITGIPVIPKQEFKNFLFETLHTEVPIVDQNGRGKCVLSALKGLIEVLRSRSGAPFFEFSDDALYAACVEGFDVGTYGGKALQELQDRGFPLKSDVQGMPLRSSQVSAAAWEAAKRFRLPPGEEGAIPLSSEEEFFTAAANRWGLYFAVQAGGSYNTDDNGVVHFLGRRLNHQQWAGEGLRLGSDGRIQFKGRNSWGPSWGQQGFAWYQLDHLLASDTVFAVKRLMEDPKDPNMPTGLPA
jgi:hypothetical protein